MTSSASTRISDGSTRLARAHELIERDVAELTRERAAWTLVQVPLPERARAADDVLPEARLRLVQAERRGAGRRTCPRWRPSGPARRGRGPPRAGRRRGRRRGRPRARASSGARRRARSPTANGCAASSRRPASKSKPIAAARRAPTARCSRRGIAAVHERVVGPRPRGDLLHERHELVAQTVQQRLEPCHAHVGLVLVEQRVVALAALVADRVGLLAAQRDEALERDRRKSEKSASARAACQASKPADSASASSRTSEAGNTYGAIALAPRLAHARALEARRDRRRRRARRWRRRSARRRSARAARPRAWPWPRRAPPRRAGAC